MKKRYEFRWVPCDPKAALPDEGFFGQTALDELLKRHHAALSGLELENTGASAGIDGLMRFGPADTLPVIQFD